MQQKKPGLFITLEGLDGVGKTTHINFIQDYIQSKGFKTYLTREPGGTEIGESIRNLLLFNHEKINKITELFLMFASRQELISNVIIPKLNEFFIVISDRFIDSSYAYQCGGRQIDTQHIDSLISMLDGYLTPDLTILFDADINIIFERINKSTKKDRIENENLEFFNRIKSVYSELQKKNSQRIKIISTEKNIEVTQSKIIEIIDDLLIRKNLV